MKIFKFLAVAFVAMCGFTSCEKHECDFIEVDHNADFVGTWTCLTTDFAEALVISADGSVVSTGIEDGEYWEGIKGNIKTNNNKMTLTFEDGDNYEGRFEMICGEAFTIFNEEGDHLTYRYCANDLADEIVGMWVCNDGPMKELGEITIQTYTNDGKLIVTTATDQASGSPIVNKQDSYFVVGDLLFFNISEENMSAPQYIATRLVYAANGTSLGDIMTQGMYISTENGMVETTASFLRVKQDLHLEGHKYEYSNVYVSNVKGSDKEVNFMGHTVSMATLDGSKMEMLLKSVLFGFEFPDANTISYSYQLNGNKETYNVPLEVEGNKMSIKMSAKVPTLKDVVFYAFQDTDDCQIHLYMHQTAFVNFFANMQAMLMMKWDASFDITNADAINAIYNEINEAVETINVSLVLKEK